MAVPTQNFAKECTNAHARTRKRTKAHTSTRKYTKAHESTRRHTKAPERTRKHTKVHAPIPPATKKTHKHHKTTHCELRRMRRHTCGLGHFNSTPRCGSTAKSAHWTLHVQGRAKPLQDVQACLKGSQLDSDCLWHMFMHTKLPVHT